ncbi:MAG: LamG domain-containing protein, partial [Flavisolibacter sp.]|nr:LamG domain-containing protein [Flavisolibacter sp.]
MKRTGYQLLCLSLLFVFIPTLLHAQNNKSLIGHWTFDEEKGKVALDEVTKGRDSIHSIFNLIRPYQDPIRRKGIANGALVFDGFSNWIEIPASRFTTPTKAITISVWVVPRAFEHGDGGKLSAIINQQDKKAFEGFALGIYRHGSWSFQLGNGKEWMEIWDEGHALPRREWSYLTATYDAAKSAASLYLNGELIVQKKLSNALSIKPSSLPLRIGKH